MVELAATGQRGKAKINLRNLLAESATFQTAVGATGTTEEKIAAAKLRLHRTAYEPDSGTFVRPFGLIISVGNDKNENTAVKQFTMGGDIEVRLERGVPEGYQDNDKIADAEVDFENFYEGVMNDAMDLSIQPGYFVINSWDIIEGPYRYEEEEVYGIRILINWGLS